MTQFWNCTPFDLPGIPRAHLIPQSPIMGSDPFAAADEAIASGAEVAIVDVEINPLKGEFWTSKILNRTVGMLQLLGFQAPEMIRCYFPHAQGMRDLPISVLQNCDRVGVPAYYADNTTLGVWNRIVSRRIDIVNAFDLFGIKPMLFVSHRRGGMRDETERGGLLGIPEWKECVQWLKAFGGVWWCRKDEDPAEAAPYIAEFGVVG